MEKLHAEQNTTKRSYKASSVLLLAAVVVMALSVTVSAVVKRYTGEFTLTGGMSDAEIQEMLQEASVGVTVVEEPDGTRHYFDVDGNETMVLSKEEAEAYERAKQAQWERTVKEPTTLVDLSTMPLLPIEVTELPSGEDGRIADFTISNGALVLLHPEGKGAYELKTGDTVTITLDSNDECYLEFGCFKDGVFLDGETDHARQHSYTFTIREDGLYCFYVENCSTDMSAFQNCAIVVG